MLKSLKEMRDLEDGWLDGDGLAPTEEPRLFPTPGGMIQAEWSFDNFEIEARFERKDGSEKGFEVNVIVFDMTEQ